MFAWVCVGVCGFIAFGLLGIVWFWIKLPVVGMAFVDAGDAVVLCCLLLVGIAVVCCGFRVLVGR